MSWKTEEAELRKQTNKKKNPKKLSLHVCGI
jgi:hypothetical protein